MLGRWAIVMVSQQRFVFLKENPSSRSVTATRTVPRAGSKMACVLRVSDPRLSHTSQWRAVILWQCPSREEQEDQHPQRKPINKPLKSEKQTGACTPGTVLLSRGPLFPGHTPGPQPCGNPSVKTVISEAGVAFSK